MAPAAANDKFIHHARRLAIQLQPPCVHLEYEELKEGQQPKKRVRTVHLPSLQGHEIVDELTRKVLLNFPRHLDPATVKHKQLHRLVAQLVAHATQQHQAPHKQQQQDQLDAAGSLQRSPERTRTKAGSEASVAAKLPQHLGVKLQQGLRLDNVSMVVSVLRRITQSAAGAALAQQLQSSADAGPVQRCTRLLDWAYQVYAHIPPSQLKAIPPGTAPPPDLDATIAASLQSMSKQSTAEDDQEQGFIKAYRPERLPDHISNCTSSTDSTTMSTTRVASSSSQNGNKVAPAAHSERSSDRVEHRTQDQPDTMVDAAMLQQTASASTTLRSHTVRQADNSGVTRAWGEETAVDTRGGSASAKHATTSSSAGSSSSPAPAPQRWAAPAAARAALSDDDDDCLTLEVEVDGNVDLNKVSDYELKLAKEAMDKDFQKTLLRPGDVGFEYDRQVDFAPAAEANEWDEDASESDESVF